MNWWAYECDCIEWLGGLSKVDKLKLNEVMRDLRWKRWDEWKEREK